MNVLFILVPVALMLAGLGAMAFRWAVKDGQFDDLDSPSFRMLIDDEKPDTRNGDLGNRSARTNNQ